MRSRRLVFVVGIFAVIFAQHALTLAAQEDSKCGRPIMRYFPLADKGTDPPELLSDAKSFMKRHSQDPLITIWPKDPYVSGILEVAGRRIYEVTCPKWGPFDHNTFGMVATQVFLLYERENGKLTRLNLIPESWVSLPKGGAAKCASKDALKEFARFLKWIGARDDWQPEERTFLFAALMLHELPANFPCAPRPKGRLDAREGRELPKEQGAPSRPESAQSTSTVLYYPGLLITASFNSTFTSGRKLVSLCYVRLADESGRVGE